MPEEKEFVIYRASPKNPGALTLTHLLVFLLFVLVCTGCQSTFGPSALQRTHPGYNQAIVTSLDQQMLLNLVRLKYRDSPYFLDVANVTASLEVVGNIGIDSSLNLDTGVDILKPNIGLGYSDRPTISYTPLRGEKFLKNILSPIRLEDLLLMTQSGWSIERVFGIALERINQLNNAPRASGPTPEHEPAYKEFKRFLSLLRELQLKGFIEIGPGLESNSRNLVILLKGDPEHQHLIEEIRALLNILEHTQSNQFDISTNFLDIYHGEWDVRVRSIAGVLFYLSQNIDIPQPHVDAGWVTVTQKKNGEPFDWNDTPAGLAFKVQSSFTKPAQAFVAVPYRGAWFYISDDDLESKTTFMLLGQLFSLQAGQDKAMSPTLTLPVGAGR